LSYLLNPFCPKYSPGSGGVL